VHRKDYGWSVMLVYNPSELPGVMTVRPGVAGVLQISVTPRVMLFPNYLHYKLNQASSALVN
jgi:hypothetical protein